MRRLLLIARREYVAYIKTVGFWLSILATPLIMGLFYGGPLLLQRSAPISHVSVIDLTGGVGLEPLIERRAAERGLRLTPPPPVQAGTGHIAAGKLFTPALSARKGPDALDIGLVVYRDGPAVRIDAWSRNPAGDPTAEGAARDAVGDWMRGEMLRSAGVDPGLARALETARPEMSHYSASGEGLGFATARLPALVSFAMAMGLFTMIMAGASILLNSVVEEKSTRILEVLLTSADPGEILGGKILGAAGIAGTIVSVWAGVGLGILSATQPLMAHAVGEFMLGRGMALYFLLYLVGGYVMFAAIFTTVGAFCETTREAQSLVGPLMILLMMPVVVMTQVMTHPDMPLLVTLSWIPTFTPFLMIARASTFPPLWQVIGTAVEMVVASVVVVRIAARAFRTGALTSGRLSLAAVIARVRQGD